MNSLRSGPRSTMLHKEATIGTKALFDTTDVNATLLVVKFNSSGIAGVTIDISLESKIEDDNGIVYASHDLTKSGIIRIDNHGAIIRSLVTNITNQASGVVRGITASGNYYYALYDSSVVRYTKPGFVYTPTWTCNLDAANADPDFIATNDTYLFVGDETDNKVYAYAIADGAYTSASDITLDSSNQSIDGMHCDGTTLWVADGDDNWLYAYTASSGALDATKGFAIPLAGSGAFDGTTAWSATGTELIPYDPEYNSISFSPEDTSKSRVSFPLGTSVNLFSIIDNYVYFYHESLQRKNLGTSDPAEEIGIVSFDEDSTVDLLVLSGATSS